MLAGITASCGSGRQAQKEATPTRITPTMTGGESHYLPKAHIYKTNGDYNDNVPIAVGNDGKTLLSFPAPTDITTASDPVKLSDGWLLDRRGVNANTVFTRYTYEEYMQLLQAPTMEQLLESVIPGSRVTELVALPIDMSKAIADPSLCESYIANGLKDCTPLIK